LFLGPNKMVSLGMGSGARPQKPKITAENKIEKIDKKIYE